MNIYERRSPFLKLLAEDLQSYENSNTRVCGPEAGSFIKKGSPTKVFSCEFLLASTFSIEPFRLTASETIEFHMQQKNDVIFVRSCECELNPLITLQTGDLPLSKHSNTRVSI